MTRRFCDRCGVEEGAQRIVGTAAGFSLDHTERVIDLCGDCRADLRELLDGWLKEKSA